MTQQQRLSGVLQVSLLRFAEYGFEIFCSPKTKVFFVYPLRWILEQRKEAGHFVTRL
jgi:hypothetical protein